MRAYPGRIVAVRCSLFTANPSVSFERPHIPLYACYYAVPAARSDSYRNARVPGPHVCCLLLFVHGKPKCIVRAATHTHPYPLSQPFRQRGRIPIVMRLCTVGTSAVVIRLSPSGGFEQPHIPFHTHHHNPFSSTVKFTPCTTNT